MQLNFTTCFSILALFVTLSACQDHRISPPSAPQFRLKKEVKAFANGPSFQGNIETTTYTYNSSGKLASYNYLLQNFAVGINDTITGVLIYDAQNRLSKIQTKRITSGHPVAYQIAQQLFSYDTNGDIVSVQRYAGSVDISSQDTIYFQPDAQKNFTYDGNHLPVKEIDTFSQTPYYAQYGYAYSGGNVTNVDFTSSNPIVDSSTSLLQYDDKPNPYFGLLIDRDLGFQVFSRNNALYATDQLIYNSQGLLVQKTSSYPNNRNLNAQSTYEYEPY